MRSQVAGCIRIGMTKFLVRRGYGLIWDLSHVWHVST
jgi:hypothetical protein